MFPVLIDLGTWDLPLLGETPIFLPTYGVLFALSVLIAWGWFVKRARTLDIDDERLFNLIFITLLSGILGAKLLLIVVDWRHYLNDPGSILGTLRSAGVLAGGVIGGGLAFGLYCRRHGLPAWRLSDAIAAPLVLAQGVGRLGCFAAGCCWGAETDAGHPLAVVFTNPFASAHTGVPLNVPLVAVQLIQMTLDLGLALLLTVLWRRRVEPPGTVLWIYVLLYSLSRGIVEFWRGDSGRGLYFGDHVSTSQLLAFAAVLISVVALVRGRTVARAGRA